MGMRDRKDLAEQLLKRAQESYERKEDSGRFGTIFKLGAGPFWKCSVGEHVIDIIPYLCSENYPTKNYPNVKPGDPVYVLDIWVHPSVGPNEDTVVCPARNYGLPCPICEDCNDLRKKEIQDKDRIKELTPKRRSIYNIVCYDSASEEGKGVQIWDVAYFFMEKHLAERARKPKSGGYIHFPHPDQGKQVYFKRVGTGLQNTEYLAHTFMDRDYVLSDAVLGQAKCLDGVLSIHTYDQIVKLHRYASPVQETEPVQEVSQAVQPLPVRQPRPAPTANGTVAPSPAQTTAAPETTLRPRGVPPTTAAPTPGPAAATGIQCPGGGTFGVDVDNLTNCGTCPLWDNCASEATRREKEARK